jgi:prepilin-type N-terminal cleavage/methylation domain-containing protein
MGCTVHNEEVYPMAKCRRTGFTLIELLVVLAIIGTLVGLLLPAVQSAREAARQMQCQNHLKQWGLAIANFEAARGYLPPARIAPRPGDSTELSCGGEEPNWFAYVLPFVEQTNLVRDVDLFGKWYEQPKEFTSTKFPILFCPSRRGSQSMLVSRNVGGTTGATRLPCGCPIPGRGGSRLVDGVPGDYAACHGDLSPGAVGLPSDFYYGGNGSGAMNSSRPLCENGKTVDFFDKYRYRDITDGLSNTFLLGEKHISQERLGKFPDDSPIYDGDSLPAGSRVTGPGMPLAQGPNDLVSTYYAFGSWHPGITHFLYADGSIRSLSNATDTVTLGQLANRHNLKLERIQLD